MALTKKKRKVIVGVIAAIAWFLLWGLGGYFFGFRGIGFGWPGFWAVGGMSLLVPLVIGGLVTLFTLSGKWIERSER